MKLFKYGDFINESVQSKEDIDKICRRYSLRRYTINDDGSVDVDGDVNLSVFGAIYEIPLKFGIVSGDFFCGNTGILNLKGSPKEVGGDFVCYYNDLTSLEGCPTFVGGSFRSTHNKLITLEGAPKEVGGYFDCSYNKLTSLEGCPEKVIGNFDCSSNKLTNLKGGPKEVFGNFFCDYNKLTSLEGSPKEFNGDFWCMFNKLASLEGSPKKVGEFRCSNNRLTSLIGGPKEVSGNYICSSNKIKNVIGFPNILLGRLDIDYNPILEIFKLFPINLWKELPEFLNEYDVIRPAPKDNFLDRYSGTIVLQALELCFDELKVDINLLIELEINSIKKYKLI